MVTEAVAATIAYVIRALAELEVPSALMGGVAVSNWRHSRVTHDVDLLVGIQRVQVSRLLNDLVRRGIRPKKQPPVFVIDKHTIVPLIYQPPDSIVPVQLDLLLAESAFQRRALERRVLTTLPFSGEDVNVLSCEDLILFKVIAGRVLDQADVAALMRINIGSEPGDLLSRATELKLNADVERLKQEALSED